MRKASRMSTRTRPNGIQCARLRFAEQSDMSDVCFKTAARLPAKLSLKASRSTPATRSITVPTSSWLMKKPTAETFLFLPGLSPSQKTRLSRTTFSTLRLVCAAYIPALNDGALRSCC